MPRNRDRRYVNNIEMFSWYVKKNAKWVFNRRDSKYDGCVKEEPEIVSEIGDDFVKFAASTAMRVAKEILREREQI